MCRLGPEIIYGWWDASKASSATNKAFESLPIKIGTSKMQIFVQSSLTLPM